MYCRNSVVSFLWDALENIVFKEIQSDFLKTYVYANYLLLAYKIISWGHLAPNSSPIRKFIFIYILIFENVISFINTQLENL